jgi:hypothetical protein
MSLLENWKILRTLEFPLEYRRTAYNNIVRYVYDEKLEKWELHFQKIFGTTQANFENYIQDVFFRIYRIKVYEPNDTPLKIMRNEGDILRFFYRAIRNHIIDVNRKAVREILLNEDLFQQVPQNNVNEEPDPLELLINQEDTINVRELLNKEVPNDPQQRETIQMIKDFTGLGLGDRMWKFYNIKQDCAKLLVRFYSLQKPPSIYIQLKNIYNEYSQRTVEALTVQRNDCANKFKDFLNAAL